MGLEYAKQYIKNMKPSKEVVDMLIEIFSKLNIERDLRSYGIIK